MTRFWQFLRHLFARDPDTPAHAPAYTPDRDPTVRWLRMQRHLSEKSERRLRTTSEELFPARKERQS